MKCLGTFVGIFLILTISISCAYCFIHGYSGGGCECFNDDCGCCEYMEEPIIRLNGTLCANITYLRDDYGMAITITYNTYTVFNETISARNPPPMCFGIPDLEKIHADICLRLYDLSWSDKYFHGCSSLSISLVHVIHKTIQMGCFNIPKELGHHGVMDFLHRVQVAVKDELELFESLNEVGPVVQMV